MAIEGDWTAGLEAAEFPGGAAEPAPGELRIAFEKRPYAQMVGHAMSDPEVELCGVLVGRVLKDRAGPYLHVTHVIQGTAAREAGASVTFTHDTWNHINAEMDRHHAGRRIVGWYHTHGGFGIFLSEMDTFVHQNFFQEPFHVAYVYDPLAGLEGFFRWDGKTFHAARRYWLAGKPRAVRSELLPIGRAGTGGGELPTSAGVSEVADAVRGLAQKVDQLALARSDAAGTAMLAAAVVAVTVLLAAWLWWAPRRAPEVVPIATTTQGVVYGVEAVYAQDSSRWRPAFQDAQGILFYVAKVTHLDGANLPAIKDLPGLVPKPGASAPAPTAVPPAAGEDGQEQPRTSLWGVAAGLAAVVAVVVLSLIAIARRMRRHGGHR